MTTTARFLKLAKAQRGEDSRFKRLLRGAGATRFGVVIIDALFPRVVASLQPWALGRNPVGILSRMAMLLFLAAFCFSARGQAELVDQASPKPIPYLLEERMTLDHHPVQSFVPDLSAVGFARFYVGNVSNPNNGIGATISVLLRSTSFDGPVLSSTTPLTLPATFQGYQTFLFPGNVPVNAGEKYFLELQAAGPVDQWEAAWGQTAYLQGQAYVDGKPYGIRGYGLTFSEGVVIPEPATPWLLAMGMAVLACSYSRRGSGARQEAGGNHDKRS